MPRVGWLRIIALASLMAAVVGLQVVQAAHPPLPLPTDSGNMLYVRSPAFMKRAALSYDALVADIYWIRTVQHYGSTKLANDKKKQYDLLYPFLDLTTSLDPSFDIAYQFGAIFLAEPFPSGAGRPDQAIALLQKGLRMRPADWQLAQELGFVYYWWLVDNQSAGEWFNRAADMPGSPNWLRPLAAVTLAEGGNTATSRKLWTQVAETSEADWLRRQARFRLAQLDAMDEIDILTRAVQTYRARVGMLPHNWLELVRVGLLRGIPVDPDRHVLQLNPETGKVTLAPDSPLNPLPDSEHRL